MVNSRPVYRLEFLILKEFKHEGCMRFFPLEVLILGFTYIFMSNKYA